MITRDEARRRLLELLADSDEPWAEASLRAFRHGEAETDHRWIASMAYFQPLYETRAKHMREQEDPDDPSILGLQELPRRLALVSDDEVRVHSASLGDQAFSLVVTDLDVTRIYGLLLHRSLRV